MTLVPAFGGPSRGRALAPAGWTITASATPLPWSDAARVLRNRTDRDARESVVAQRSVDRQLRRHVRCIVSGMTSKTKSEAAEARRKQRAVHQAEGTVSGLVAGAVVGAVGGPLAAVAGAVIGVVAGAVAGSELDGATGDLDELEPAAEIKPPLISKIESERLEVREALEAKAVRRPRKGPGRTGRRG